MHSIVVITALALQTAQPCVSSHCYDKTCFTESCLQEAIDAKTVSTCQMDETFGCSYTKMVSSSVMVIAKCASRDCMPLHTAPVQETLCCTDNLCNNGTHIPDTSATAHCHSYTCISGWNCLQEGISAGYSRTCAQDKQYGCFFHKSQSGSVVSVRAGCSKRTCQSISAEVGENRDEYICCTGNLCNDGNKRDDNSKNNGVRIYTANVLVAVFSTLITIVLIETRTLDM